METVAVISKVQKGFIAAIGLSIVIVIVSLIGINSQTRESSSPEANEQKPFEPVTEVTENFYLRISGDLFKTETGYRLDEGFIPSLAQTLPKDQAQTPYSIVATDIDGSQKTYYSLAKYCAPTGSDYCIGKDALLMPIGERSFWEPTTILITNVTQSIEIRVQNKTIKTFQKVGRGPSILSFSKKEAKQKLYGEERSGIDVTWEIEDGNNGRSWPLLEYMTNEESWQPLYAFLDPKKYRSYFIDPKSNIHTTLDVITLRLLVTDGFFLAQQNLEPIPLTIEDKKITLSLSGVTHGGIRTVGQNTNIDVRFMDPETGKDQKTNTTDNNIIRMKFV